MTTPSIKDLLAVLAGLDLPYAQIQFYPEHIPKLPYVIVEPMSTRNVFADGLVHKLLVPYQVMLYTERRDVPLEQRVQDALNEAGIPWERFHTVDDVGHAIVAVYEVTVTEE